MSYAAELLAEVFRDGNADGLAVLEGAVWRSDIIVLLAHYLTT